MLALSRILCAVDFSRPAKSAFARALALGRDHGAELTVVHAVPAGEPFGWRGRDRATLETELRRAAEVAGVTLRVRVQHGNPAGVILLHAGAAPFDLVVVGTHQRGGVERLRRGSIAARVIRGAGIPVLVVPASRDAAGWTAAAPFEHVLCAADLRHGATGPLDAALAAARFADSRVTVLHVLEDAAPDLAPAHGPRAGVTEYRRLRTAETWRHLQRAIPRESRRKGRVLTRVAVGRAPDEILRLAAEGGADLIVVGVTSRGAVGHLLMGSTAVRVVRRAPCAVLAVPAGTRREMAAHPPDGATRMAA